MRERVPAGLLMPVETPAPGKAKVDLPKAQAKPVNRPKSRPQSWARARWARECWDEAESEEIAPEEMESEEMESEEMGVGRDGIGQYRVGQES